VTFEEIQSALDNEQKRIRQLAQEIIIHAAMLEQLRSDLKELILVSRQAS
jgi:hypothetical protein